MSNIFDPVLAGIVRILDRQQQVVGTGFVISLFPQTFVWIITSSQVIELATGMERGEILRPIDQEGEEGEQEKVHIPIVFHIDPTEKQWNATIVNWLGSERENICVLRVDGKIPALVRKLPLIRATHAEGRRVSIFGYPAQHLTLDGAWRYSEICRPGPKLLATKHIFLQIETRAMTNSYRGAPVWDDIRRRVLGIVVDIERQGEGELQLENTYAVPAELIESIHRDTFRIYEVPVATTSPYHSNEPFAVGDADSFHGYETVIDKLLDLLDGTHKILVMLGPEKSGKTSVVQAGLIPRLQNMYSDDHPDWSIFKTELSTSDPLNELGQQGLTGASDNLVSSLHTWQQKHGGSKMVLILDHFENILLHCTFEKQQHFIQHLLQSVEEHAASILLIMRDVFYSLLAKHERLILLAEENFINVFSPQKKEDLISMVRQRSDIPNVLLKPELLEKIYDKATANTSTHQDKHSSTIARFEALLEQADFQHQQQLTNESSRETTNITEINLDTLVIYTGDWAEKIFLSLGKEEYVVQHLLTQMVLLGEDGIPDTKYYQPIEALCAGDAEKHNLLEILVDKGLLITNRDRNTGNETITLAQDALLHEWVRMRDWLNEKKRFLFWRQGIQAKWQKWQSESAHMYTDDEGISTHLLLNVALNEAIYWSDLYAHDLNPEEMLFIQTSRSYQHEKEKKQLIELRNGINREIKQKQEEEKKRRSIHLAHHLAVQAKAIFKNAPQLLQQSVLLAATSLSITASPEADHILRQGLALLPRMEKDIPIIANIFTAEFSLDGHYVAIAYDQNVEVRDFSDDDNSFFFQHETKVVVMTFSPDGDYLLTADDIGKVQLWRLNDQTHLPLYQKASVSSMTFSPGGHFVAICHWNTSISTLIIYESKHWQPVYNETYEEQIHSVVFSADDNIFVVGYVDGIVKMYSFPYQRFVFIHAYEKSMSLVAISSSAQYVAIADNDGEVTLFKLHASHAKGYVVMYAHDKDITLQKIWSQTYTGRIRKMLFTPSSSHLIIASNDATVSVWKFSNEHHVDTQTLLHNGPVYRLALSQDDLYLATTSEDHMVRVWDIHTSQEIARFKHGQYVENLAFSREHHYLFTAGDDRTVRVWDIIKSQQCLVFSQDLPLQAVAWRPNILEIAVCDENGHVQIWKIERGYDPQIRLQLSDTYPIQSLFYSPDGRYIITKSVTTIVLWNAENGEHAPIRTLTNSHLCSFAFSADSNLLAIGNGTTLTLWETISGQLKASQEYDERIYSIVFHANNNVLAIGFEHSTVHLWHWQKVNDQSELFSLPLNNGTVHTLVFSSDSYHLVAISDNGFGCVWAWETEKDTTRFEIPHEAEVHTICFSPNDRLIATVSTNDQAYIWDVTDRVVIFQQEAVRKLVFSPDGFYLATIDNENNVSIWNIITGTKLVSLTHDDVVASMAFSSDGKFLTTGSKNGTVKSWMWQPQDLIQDACRRVTHNLTQDEWEEYAGKDEPYYKLDSTL